MLEILRKYQEKYPNVPYKAKQKNKRVTIISSQKNNKLHSYGDAPAYILFIDRKFFFEKWYKNDILHRTNGPAVIRVKKDLFHENEEWWYNGKFYTKEEFKKLKITESNLKNFIKEIF